MKLKNVSQFPKVQHYYHFLAKTLIYFNPLLLSCTPCKTQFCLTQLCVFPASTSKQVNTGREDCPRLLCFTLNSLPQSSKGNSMAPEILHIVSLSEKASFIASCL